MKITTMALFSTLLVLGACSGGGSSVAGSSGGSSGSTATTTLSGVVADGYLEGATVCLDMNGNSKCDAGEPTATTGKGGTYSFDVNTADAANYPVIAVVGTNAIDEDTSTPVANDYVLSTPAGKHAVISPLTTMINTELKQNPAMGANGAEAAIKQKLGYSADDSVDLYANYVAASQDTSNVDASKYTHLHDVAKVVAIAVADNKDAIGTALSGTSYTLDGVMEQAMDIIVGQVITDLPTITTEVDNGTDPNTIASGVAVDTSNITTDIAQAQATSTTTLATVSDVADMYFLEYCSSGCTSDTGAYPYNYDYGNFSFSSSAFSAGRAYLYPLPPSSSPTWNWDTLTVNGSSSSYASNWPRVLGPNGWVNPSSMDVPLVDGTLSLIYMDSSNNAVGQQNYLVSKVDISGLPMQGNSGSDPTLDAQFGSSVYPTGAIEYKMNLQQEGDDYEYSNGNSPYSSTMTSVSDLISNTTAQLFYTVYHQDGSNSEYQFLLAGSTSDTKGLVHFYTLDSSNGLYDIPAADGNWDRVTVGGVEVLRVFPPAIIGVDSAWPVLPAFAMDTGGLYQVDFIPGGTVSNSQGLFNKTALDAQTAALGLPTVP